MAKLFFFCKSLPLVLDLGRLVAPLLANDLRYLGIGETRVLRNDAGLVVLTI